MSREDARNFARSVVTRTLLFDGLSRAVPALVAQGIPVMPLKGILLACCLPDVLDRPLADADLLVPRALFPRALSVLVRLGGRALPCTRVQKCPFVFGGPLGEWNLDLHADLWPPGFIPLDVDEAWTEATPLASPFGAILQVPPRRFTFAHVVCHFARSGHAATTPPGRAREVAALLDWTLEHETPTTLATYLTRQGAAAAASYALAAAVAATSSPAAAALLTLLGVRGWRGTVLSTLALRSGVHARLLRPLVSEWRGGSA